MTNRADRGLDLMAAKGKFSEADFLAIKWDKHYAPQSRAMAYIRRIADMTFAPDSLAAEGQALLAGWDGVAAKTAAPRLRMCVVGGVEGRAGRQSGSGYCTGL